MRICQISTSGWALRVAKGAQFGLLLGAIVASSGVAAQIPIGGGVSQSQSQAQSSSETATSSRSQTNGEGTTSESHTSTQSQSTSESSSSALGGQVTLPVGPGPARPPSGTGNGNTVIIINNGGEAWPEATVSSLAGAWTMLQSGATASDGQLACTLTLQANPIMGWASANTNAFCPKALFGIMNWKLAGDEILLADAGQQIKYWMRRVGEDRWRSVEQTGSTHYVMLKNP